MTSILPSSQNASRKVPSPYGSIPPRTRYIKSPIKVSRNNTFIATSRRSEENCSDAMRLEDGDDRIDDFNGMTKCSSAGEVREPIFERPKGNATSEDNTETNGFDANQQNETSDHPSKSGIKKARSKSSSIPVKTKSFTSRTSRSFINNSTDTKNIKFLLKLSAKSCFETLQSEIDRIKQTDRKIHDQASSNARSIMTLISKGMDLDHQIRDLRKQNERLILEKQEKDRIQQDSINEISCELNELKSICNLLLKNVEKNHQLDILARKLRKAKRIDSNACKMPDPHPIEPSSKKTHSNKSLQTAALDGFSTKKSDSCRLSTRQKSGWSSLSSMSSVVTGSDMLTDIPSSSIVSHKSIKQSTESVKTDQNLLLETEIKPKKRSGLIKIICCGGRSKQTKTKHD